MRHYSEEHTGLFSSLLTCLGAWSLSHTMRWARLFAHSDDPRDARARLGLIQWTALLTVEETLEALDKRQ